MNAVLAGLVACIALASIAPSLRDRPLAWTPDGLFYQAKLLEIRGDSEQIALRKVFRGPIGAWWRHREASLPPATRQISDPDWVRYSTRFYERRWIVPLLGAALYPFFESGALHVVAALGYAAFAGILFLFLRLRFSPAASAIAAAVVLALAPLRLRAHLPLTDTVALALEVGAFATAWLALARGRHWLPLWCLVALALSFTRDTALVVVVATIWVALRTRTRLSAVVAGIGVVAAVIPLILFGAPWRETLAYTFNGHFPVRDESWHFVASRYPSNLGDLARQDWHFVLANPIVGAVFATGLLLLFLPHRKGHDNLISVLRAGAVGGLLYLLLLPYYSSFRLELVFLPAIATGLAVGLDRLHWSKRIPRPAALRTALATRSSLRARFRR